MKNLSVYKVLESNENQVKFDMEKMGSLIHVPLTDLQQSKIGFVPVVKDEMIIAGIADYTIFKLRASKRVAVKQDAIERELQHQIKKFEREDTPYDMDVICGEVTDMLTRTSNITSKDYLVIYDKVNDQFLFDCNTAVAQEGVSIILKSLSHEIDLALVETEPFILQKVLTSYLTDRKMLPDLMEVEEKVTLGTPTPAGKKPKGANITIKKEYLGSPEVLNHIKNNKVVHSLDIELDGGLFFNIDHRFNISGITYENHLDFEESSELSVEDNFVAEYTLKLAEISKVLNILYLEVENNTPLEED